jgi:phosphate transport system substrate-binding protein
MRNPFNVALAAAMMLASAVSHGLAADQSVTIDGSTTVGPIVKAFAEHFKQVKGVNVTVSESGSGNGAKSLINGVCDVASMSRFMKDTEFRAAIEKSVFPVAHVVAFDGLVMVVHPSNPIQKLTIEQVRDIYSGKLTNWRELGGPDHPIVAISRDTNSGTYETFAHMVMKEAKVATNIEHVGSNGAARQNVRNTPGAIAYVGLGFVDRSLKPITVGEIPPTRRNIASGRYPLARPLYLFTDRYPELGSATFSFVTFHLTKEGERIIQAKGFVPLTECEGEEPK